MASEAPARDVRHYLGVLRRRLWVIVVVMLVCVGASVAYSVTATPVYEATTQLLLTPSVAPALLAVNNASANSSASTVDVPTDEAVIESASVRDQVERSVPGAPKVSVSQDGQTNVVDLLVRSTDPELARRAANAYAEAYTSTQLADYQAELTRAESLITARINSVNAAIRSLEDQIALAPTSAGAAPLTQQLAGEETQLSVLEGDDEQYQITMGESDGGGEIVGLATTPTSPVSPKPLEYAVLAALVGVVLGATLVLLVDYFDDALRTRADLERLGQGMPILGIIPDFSSWRNRKETQLPVREFPKSPAAEAYRALRTSVQFLGLDRSLHTVLVSGLNASEGKTTTLANTAVALAEAGQRVVVVCCDLRRPRLHEFFGLNPRVGLTSVLLGEVALGDALQPVPGMTRLQVLTSGPVPPNPSELLSSEAIGRVLSSLSQHADIVLVDSPPVLPVTDATVLSGKVDGVVLVAAAGISSRHDVDLALATLRRVNAPLLGFVLNRATEADSYTYYRYSAQDEPPRTRGDHVATRTNGRGSAKGNGRGAPAATLARPADGAGSIG